VKNPQNGGPGDISGPGRAATQALRKLVGMATFTTGLTGGFGGCRVDEITGNTEPPEQAKLPGCSGEQSVPESAPRSLQRGKGRSRLGHNLMRYRHPTAHFANTGIAWAAVALQSHGQTRTGPCDSAQRNPQPQALPSTAA
jgi:hypothetical protein